MSEICDALLTALAGSSAQQPLALWQLVGRLPGPPAPEAEIAAALDDLVARRAVNAARLSADGVRWRDVYWLTGLPPQLRGVEMRKPVGATANALNLTNPLLQERETTKEMTMPRISAPARKTSARPGEVRDQALRALADVPEHAPLTVEQVAELCPGAGGIGSVRKTLQSLASQGRIGRSIVGRGRYRYAVHWGLPGHGAEGPSAEPAPQRRDSAPLTEQAAACPPSLDAPSDVLSNVLGLEGVGRCRYALWDDGILLIKQGDDALVLNKQEARRLVDFLEGCMEVLQ